MKTNLKYKYIVIEGPIGVGKTTLAQRLSEELQGRLVLEEAEENPFLPQFYQDPQSFAFQTQVFFLLSRYRQQQQLTQQHLFQPHTVSDYLFAKDFIFAQLNLSPEEINLYQTIYKALGAQVPKPDLVIFLQADLETLRHRIRKRGIAYERHISGDYIERLSQAYNRFFFEYDNTPLLTVNCSDLNLASNEADYQTLLKEILKMQKKNLEKHYVSIRN